MRVLCIAAIFLISIVLIEIRYMYLKREKKRFEEKNDSYEIKTYTFSPLFPSEEIMERAYEILNEEKKNSCYTLRKRLLLATSNFILKINLQQLEKYF